MTMKHRDLMFTLGQLSSSTILGEAQTMALKEAEYILADLSKRFEMVGLDAHVLLHSVVKELEAPRLTTRIVEQLSAFRHFAEEVPELLDTALACDIHDAERIKSLYRTLDLSDIEQARHEDAGKNAFLYSGRESGDDDDTVALIFAKDDEEAKAIFLRDHLHLDLSIPEDDEEEEEEEEEGTIEDPKYFIITNDHIGIVDHRGRIALK